MLQGKNREKKKRNANTLEGFQKQKKDTDTKSSNASTTIFLSYGN